VKDSERKAMSERKRNLHPLVTMDTGSLSREVSYKDFAAIRQFFSPKNVIVEFSSEVTVN
jgi:hypothetical protein